jgi:hypothetical protein
VAGVAQLAECVVGSGVGAVDLSFIIYHLSFIIYPRA